MARIKLETVTALQEEIEENSKLMEDIVEQIVCQFSEDLDNYVYFIRGCLQNGERQLTNEELDDICMNLSTLIYYASYQCESLGIKDDISKALYKEIYHSKRSELSSGTVADKNSLAELQSQNEQLTAIAYSRAYKMLKAKVESAQELLSSAKKLVSRRMQEYELTRMGGSDK